MPVTSFDCWVSLFSVHISVGLTNYAILGIVLAVVILISVLLLLAVILHRKLWVLPLYTTLLIHNHTLSGCDPKQETMSIGHIYNTTDTHTHIFWLYSYRGNCIVSHIQHFWHSQPNTDRLILILHRELWNTHVEIKIKGIKSYRNIKYSKILIK